MRQPATTLHNGEVEEWYPVSETFYYAAASRWRA